MVIMNMPHKGNTLPKKPITLCSIVLYIKRLVFLFQYLFIKPNQTPNIVINKPWDIIIIPKLKTL